MGDRVIVVCKETFQVRDKAGKITGTKESFSEGVYLHWGGDRVLGILVKAAPFMRKGDPTYAIARFCGVAHEETKKEAPTGLGILPGPKTEEPGFNWEKYSHGDAGVVIVDMDTGKVEAKAGYLADEKIPDLELFADGPDRAKFITK